MPARSLNIYLLIFIANLFLGVSCAIVPRQPASPRLIPGDFSGIVHALRIRTQEEYTLLDDLHVSWVLNTFYWDIIERRQDEWDFSEYDAFINAAEARGKKVCAVLAYEAVLAG